MTEYRDVLCNNTTIKLSFLDRLRVLIRGTVSVRFEIATENEVGETETTSRAWAQTIWRRRPSLGGGHEPRLDDEELGTERCER